MKIAIIGYGKMGKTIEKIARERNHDICLVVDEENRNDLQSAKLSEADVAIEFTRPEAAPENILCCLEAGLPIVVGTTGWLDHLGEIEKKCAAKNGSLFHASNFSIGVNIFFAINRQLARLMDAQADYDVNITETHHIHKADAPSGTALTLAEGILENLDRKKAWTPSPSLEKDKLQIASIRRAEVPGTHEVFYESDIDTIEIRHTAKSRHGFGLGAVIAAEWLPGKKGIYTMNDLLKI